MRGRSHGATLRHHQWVMGGEVEAQGRIRDLPTCLFVRNIHYDCRQEDFKRSFEQFGPLKDIYMPRDYYTGDPRGFGFVHFVDPADAANAKHHMDGYLLLGRKLIVAFGVDSRKNPIEMRARESGEQRISRLQDRNSPPRDYSRAPRYSRSRGGSPLQSGDYYSRPPRRHHPRSISPREERYDRGRAYSRSQARGKSRSIRPSLGRSISRSPRRSISLNPRRNWSQSPRRSRSVSPRKGRSYTSDAGRSRSESPCGEQYEDRSPSQ